MKPFELFLILVCVVALLGAARQANEISQLKGVIQQMSLRAPPANDTHRIVQDSCIRCHTERSIIQ